MSQEPLGPATRRHGLSEQDAQELCERLLGFARADHTRINVTSGWRGFTRTATNRITAAGGSSDVTVQITSVFGKRVGSISTNRLEDPHLERAVHDAEALAKLAPENPEYLPELEKQKYEKVEAYYDSTGNLAPDDQAAAAVLALRAARDNGLVASGYIDVRARAVAVATSSSLFAYHRETGAASTLTVRTSDGSSSGWAGNEAADWEQIESERVARDAVEKCQRWRGKTALDPGPYTVVLEPTAVGMLMLRLGAALDARQADEGRNYFSKSGGGNRAGEKLFDSRITITSDPAASNAETAPFNREGLPVKREVWVEKGVLKNLVFSRFWAQEKGVEPRARPSNLLLSEGGATVEDMIRSTERGVLITRFWYIRRVDPRRISFTGLTRDGTFLIENGRITRPVNNFRFNQSLAELLQNVDMLGRATRVAAGEDGSVARPILVPAMKVRDFQLASVSDAI